MFTHKRFLTILCATAMLLAAGADPNLIDTAFATPPSQDKTNNSAILPYSGQLKDAGDRPVADGFYDLTFSLFDSPSGGTLLWSEIQKGVDVKGGNFNISLGSRQAIPKEVSGLKELWLAIGVRGPKEQEFTALNPRQRYEAPAATSALSCPHSHFGDNWDASSASYGLKVSNAGTGDGVQGFSSSTSDNFAGVYGSNTGGDSGPGSGGSGVYGRSQYGTGGYFESPFWFGLVAKGSASYGAHIINTAGASGPGLWVDGTMMVSGSKTGYVVDVAVNDGPEALETGDVVVITGYGEPVLGQIPLVKVRKAETAGSTRIMGVVDQPLTLPSAQNLKSSVPLMPAAASARQTEGTAVAQSQYLNVVTLGAFKAVKVDTSITPVHAGDLLVASATPGHAMASYDPRLGSVIGKALGECKSGTCVIPLLVTLK